MITTDKLSEMAIQIFTEADAKVYPRDQRTAADSPRYNVQAPVPGSVIPHKPTDDEPNYRVSAPRINTATLTKEVEKIVQGRTSTHASRGQHGESDAMLPIGNAFNPNFRLSYSGQRNTGGAGTPGQTQNPALVSLEFDMALVPDLLKSGNISAACFKADNPAYDAIIKQSTNFIREAKTNELFPLKNNLWTMTNDISVTPYYRYTGVSEGGPEDFVGSLKMYVRTKGSENRQPVQLSKILPDEEYVLVKKIEPDTGNTLESAEDIKIKFYQLPGMNGHYVMHSRDPLVPAGFNDFFAKAEPVERDDEKHKVEDGPITAKHNDDAIVKSLGALPVAVNWPEGLPLPEGFYRDPKGTVWATPEAIRKWRSEHPSQPDIVLSTQPEPATQPAPTVESFTRVPKFLEFLRESEEGNASGKLGYTVMRVVPEQKTENNRPISVKLRCGPVLRGNVSPNDFVLFDKSFLKSIKVPSINMAALPVEQFQDVIDQYVVYLKGLGVYAWRVPSQASAVEMRKTQSVRNEDGELEHDPLVAGRLAAQELGDPKHRAPIVHQDLLTKKERTPRYSTKGTGIPTGPGQAEYDAYTAAYGTKVTDGKYRDAYGSNESLVANHGLKIVSLRLHDTTIGDVEIPADLIDWSQTIKMQTAALLADAPADRAVAATKVPVLHVSMRTKLNYINAGIPKTGGPSYFKQYVTAQGIQTQMKDIDWDLLQIIRDNTDAVYEVDTKRYVMWYENLVPKFVEAVAAIPEVDGSPSEVKAEHIHLKSALKGKFEYRNRGEKSIPIDQPLTYKPLLNLMYESHSLGVVPDKGKLKSLGGAYSQYDYDREVQKLLLTHYHPYLPPSGKIDESDYKDPALTEEFAILLDGWLNGYVVDPDKTKTYRPRRGETFNPEDPKNTVTDFQIRLQERKPQFVRKIDWNENLDTQWSDIIELPAAVRMIVEYLNDKSGEASGEEVLRNVRTGELYDRLTSNERETFDKLKAFANRGTLNKDEEKIGRTQSRESRRLYVKPIDPELADKFDNMISAAVKDTKKNVEDINIAEEAKSLVIDHLKNSDRGKIITRKSPRPVIPA